MLWLIWYLFLFAAGLKHHNLVHCAVAGLLFGTYFKIDYVFVLGTSNVCFSLHALYHFHLEKSMTRLRSAPTRHSTCLLPTLSKWSFSPLSWLSMWNVNLEGMEMCSISCTIDVVDFLCCIAFTECNWRLFIMGWIWIVDWREEYEIMHVYEHIQL